MILRALFVLFALCGSLRSEEAVAEPLSPTVEEAALGHSGFLYAFSFSRWSLFNSAPLAYTPFEIGYDFGNGVRLQTGMDLFYYEGTDNVVSDKGDPIGLAQFTYEMTNWRSSILYQAPLPIPLRPVLGISANIVGGSKKLARVQDSSGKDINADKPKIPAWGYTGMGVLVGLEYLINADWTASLSLRYDTTFSAVPSPLVQQLGVAVTF